MQELCQTKCFNYLIRFGDQKLWQIIRYEARHNFPNWKPHYPKKVTKIDPITKEKDVTLHIKRPRAMRNMPLMKLEQDFYEEFKGWYYDSSTFEAVISLRSKGTFIWRGSLDF
ncbi:hypothetical protein Hanom_Chr07g00621891 [Helianthus anomalus]